jgi:hypothetical protein
VSGKQIPELLRGRLERKIPNKQFCTHADSVSRLTALSRPSPTIGSQIITEAGSTEDLPGFETGESFYLPGV